MKLELKENMYVRTKDGTIGKIIAIDLAKPRQEKYPNHPSKRWWRDKILISCYKGWITTQNIIKASYDIINILEEGDYVNGQEVYYDEELDFLYVQSFDADGEFYQENIAKQSFIDNIKSVITHEQMEQMAYKVDE